MEHFTIEVKRSLHNKRLDLALVESNLGLSRRKIRKIIDLGGSYINRKRVRVASRQVKLGDTIQLEYDPKTFERVKQPLSFGDSDILYQDHGIIAVNKPAGLPSQATKTQAIFHVVPLLEAYLKERGDEKNHPLLTHRLDKETTGILLLALHRSQMKWLSDQFRDRLIDKEYHALAHGICKEPKFSVSCKLSAIHPETSVVRVLNQGGKESLTHFEVMKTFPEWNLTLFRCLPITGRTHQIRVHLERKGFPIVGDKIYGRHHGADLTSELKSMASDHHLLHCYRMGFFPKVGADKVFVEAPYPTNFKEILKLLAV